MSFFFKFFSLFFVFYCFIFIYIFINLVRLSNFFLGRFDCCFVLLIKLFNEVFLNILNGVYKSNIFSFFFKCFNGLIEKLIFF